MAAASGVTCKCFSASAVDTVFEHLWRAASGVMCGCFSAVGVGIVIEHLWRQRAASCASAKAPPA